MKLLVIRLCGVSPELLLRPGELPSIGRLMEIGRHGPVAPAPDSAAHPASGLAGVSGHVTAAGARAAVLSVPGATPDRVVERIAAGDWDYLEFVDDGFARLAAPGETSLDAALGRFDEFLGRALEALDGDAAVLVFSPAGPGASHGAYVLAGPGVTPNTDATPAALVDFERTLLELGGYEVPPSIEGRSLLCGGDAVSAPASQADEEAMIRDHLRGLGYL